MARKNTIRLLLVNASDNESERLISLFRAAGRVARAHRVSDADDLNAQLLRTPNPLDNWDLLIADDHHPSRPSSSAWRSCITTGCHCPPSSCAPTPTCRRCSLRALTMW